MLFHQSVLPSILNTHINRHLARLIIGKYSITDCASPPSDLREVVDLSADAVPQHNEHRHGHLHVALLSVVAEHLLDDGAEEAGGQVRAEQWLRNGDEREGLDGREAGDLGLVAADVRRVGLVLLQVIRC